MMYLVFENGAWVQRQPVDGELVREVISAGTSNEHYREYVYATPTPTPPDMRVTKLAFKQRMTAAERIAIRTAATTDAIVYDFMDLVDSATFIDLARQDTQDGVNYLESVGLLAAGRAAQILTNPITDEERP